MWKGMGCERDVIVIDELKGRGKRGRMSEAACREGFARLGKVYVYVNQLSMLLLFLSYDLFIN